MRRTVIYMIAALFSAGVHLSSSLVRTVKYPLKLKLCTLDFEDAMRFENERLNKILLENIDREGLDSLKTEFCKNHTKTLKSTL